MTAHQRLAHARRVVMTAALVRVVLTGVAALAGTVVLASLFDLAVGMPRPVRAAVPWLGAAAALALAAPLAWRTRRIWSDQSLALWIEEQSPLDYLLVTAVDPHVGEQTAVANALAVRQFEPAVRRAAVRGAGGSVLAAVALLAALGVVPEDSVRRVIAPRAGDALFRTPSGGRASRLRPLVARYTPPSYIGGNALMSDEPEAVRGVEGGVVEVLGLGSSRDLVATVGATTIATGTEGSRWRAVFQMPSSPAVFRVVDGADDRLIAIEPIRDSLPTVNLMLPARDTVVRVAVGRISLRASLSDDFGIAEQWFEYVTSSGSGELFRFRSGRIGGTTAGGAAGRRGGGARSDSIQAELDLDSLKLGPGDVLHIRAVARDRRPASRGLGASETRTLRVARPNDLDTAAIIALPSLPGDTAALSERLLIQLTEALEARRPRLSRPVLHGESRAISRDQARLRREVADVIFMRLTGEASAEEVGGAVQSDSALTPEALLAAAESATGQGDTAALDFAEDESPVVAINRPLLEAYNAMWDATRELDVAALTRALPHMYKALEAIQRARAAERVYLRAPAQRVVVNLAQVRLSGKREGVVVADRTAGPTDGQTQWLARLLAIVGRSDGQTVGRSIAERDALRDSLLVLRIKTLVDVPAAAAALNDATSALRRGTDPMPALNAARNALVGPPARRPAGPPSPWGGAW